jgi:hypothetical protein
MTQPPPFPPPAAYPPPAPSAPPAKAKKPIYKRWWFWVAAVIVVGIIGNAAGGGSKSESAASTAPATSSAAPAAGDTAATAEATTESPAKQAPGIGTPVRDGKFEFTVSGIDCSQTNIGGQYGQNAQGVFCIVGLHVSNIGKEAQYFDASSQAALDAQGRKFSSDSAAGIYLDNSNSFLEQLNPGSAVDGQLVYDVPTGTQLTELDLHDSPFSGGVKVSLG